MSGAHAYIPETEVKNQLQRIGFSVKTHVNCIYVLPSISFPFPRLILKSDMEINFLSKHTYIFTAVLFHFFFRLIRPMTPQSTTACKPSLPPLPSIRMFRKRKYKSIEKDRIFRQNTILKLFIFFQINSANDASKHGGLQAQPAPSAIDRCETFCDERGCHCLTDQDRPFSQIDHLTVEARNGGRIACFCGSFAVSINLLPTYVVPFLM